ncbi:Aim41p ASCRUDRAFT_76632 [Ascoidea rubescens DSM 1968]|uniref:Altered inheritance of mitochondria protein 41 n=1 Tax=Ascoidea rubescens DSM 1968 TaxID=1344418 RepID=A0A1D2VF22_9ASCO|nr:hypothetical protein ASCRUDRAFT_76632 [Ascoidea rubescens DSM 1968]ODV60120.1 hypothetical protein ASCRUDRAFT_76632 [Ascoidea rubescens DSM 1968]
MEMKNQNRSKFLLIVRVLRALLLNECDRLNRMFSLRVVKFNRNQFLKLGNLRIARYESNGTYNETISRFKEDLKKSMIKKDALRKTVIKNLLSDIKNNEINNNEKNKMNNEFQIYDVIQKSIKNHEDSILEFEKSKREDLKEVEMNELKVLSEYLESLPVAKKEDIDLKLRKIIEDLAAEDKSGKFHIGKIFSSKAIPWKNLEEEWKASLKAVQHSVVEIHKEMFPGKPKGSA